MRMGQIIDNSEYPASNPSFLESFGARLVRSISQHERLYLAFVLAVFVLSDVYKACTAPLWFDELFTLFFSRIPSISDMAKAISIDSQPPLQYFLTHPLLFALGESEFTVRLPELIACAVAGLLTYKIVRLHGTAVQGLFALSMVMGSYVVSEAYTARPYGLLLAFTALTFASWQLAALKKTGRALPLLGVTMGLAGAILSHNLGVIHVGLFLAAGETTRFIKNRRMDGWMLIAICAGLLPLAITLPMAHDSHLPVAAVLHSTNYFYRPRLGNLVTYLLMIPIPLCLLAALGLLLGRKETEPFHADNGPRLVPAHEWAAVSALALLLPVQLIFLALAVGQYATRYSISTSLGLALLAAWGLPIIRSKQNYGQIVLSLSTLCYVFITACTLALAQTQEPIWQARPREHAVSPLILNDRGNLPIAIPNTLDYVQEWWYAPAALQSRIVYLSDIPYAMKQSEFLPEVSLTVDKAYIPLRTKDYSAFVTSNPRFLLLSTGDPHLDWLSPRLAKSSWRLDLVARSGGDALYLVHR